MRFLIAFLFVLLFGHGESDAAPPKAPPVYVPPKAPPVVPEIVTYKRVTWPDTTGRACVWDWPSDPALKPVFVGYAVPEVAANRPFPEAITRGTTAPLVAGASTSSPATTGTARTITLAPAGLPGDTNCASPFG